MSSGSLFPSWLQAPIDWVHGLFGSHQQPAPAPVAPAEEHHAEQSSAPVSDSEVAKEEASPQSAPKPLEAVRNIEAAKNIEHGVLLLKAEQCNRLEKKAQGLNAQVKADFEKIKNIDKLLSLISQYAQRNADGSENATGNVDCTSEEIRSVVAALRKDGISVPIPDGLLQKGERGHVVNVLSNERNLLNDKQREDSQEMQQCAVERNAFHQAIMTLISELHRLKVKILGNIQRSA